MVYISLSFSPYCCTPLTIFRPCFPPEMFKGLPKLIGETSKRIRGGERRWKRNSFLIWNFGRVLGKLKMEEPRQIEWENWYSAIFIPVLPNDVSSPRGLSSPGRPNSTRKFHPPSAPVAFFLVEYVFIPPSSFDTPQGIHIVMTSDHYTCNYFQITPDFFLLFLPNGVCQSTPSRLHCSLF